MRRINDLILLVGLVCTWGLLPQKICLAQSTLAGLPITEKLPAVVERLSVEIQGKTAKEAEAIYQLQLGKPSRDVGSGIHIPVWDFPEGTLTVGTFIFKSGDVVWLLKTRNRLYENIVESNEYEMVSASSRDWLGDLELGTNGKFSFKVSDAFPQEWRVNQKENFFHHLEGDYKIKYASGLGPDTLLETVPNQMTLAVLSFISKDGSKADFSVVSDAKSRELFFRGTGPLSFEMSTSWKNYWKRQN